jgi:hypothetical protein
MYTRNVNEITNGAKDTSINVDPRPMLCWPKIVCHKEAPATQHFRKSLVKMVVPDGNESFGRGLALSHDLTTDGRLTSSKIKISSLIVINLQV